MHLSAFIFAISMILIAPNLKAQHSHQHTSDAVSSYAGMEARNIKTLSEQDLSELRRGGGWGLALPAELNGVPGPAHLLELKNDIPLSSKQIVLTEELFADMQVAAISAGERLIEAEQNIERIFSDRSVTEHNLRHYLEAAESARTELRFIHLSQHYKTLEYLSEAQLQRYNQLRGYADESANSPCNQVPQGHDPVMYRQHMGCDD